MTLQKKYIVTQSCKFIPALIKTYLTCINLQNYTSASTHLTFDNSPYGLIEFVNTVSLFLRLVILTSLNGFHLVIHALFSLQHDTSVIFLQILNLFINESISYIDQDTNGRKKFSY